MNSHSNFCAVLLNWNRLLCRLREARRNGCFHKVRVVVNSKSTRNLKEEMKRYSTLIVPPSFQWKVKLTMKLTYFSLFYGRPAINARIFRKVYVQLRPRDKMPLGEVVTCISKQTMFLAYT